MKTNPMQANRKFWMSAAIGLALLVRCREKVAGQAQEGAKAAQRRSESETQVKKVIDFGRE